MIQTRNTLRAAPVVQMLMGLKPQVRQGKQEHNNPATVEAFDREHLGVAAKE
jgi:hypothetical protein